MDCIDLFKRAAVALQTDNRYLVLDQARIINTAMNGGDPMTVQEPSASCTGSCSTCGGCH